MNIPRRYFLKCCAGSVAALGLDFSFLGSVGKALAAVGNLRKPTYPIASRVITTLDRTVTALPHGPRVLTPGQVAAYKANHYGEWDGCRRGFPYLRPELRVGGYVEPSDPDPSATPLLSFFTMSDVHITDKESPAQCPYLGYNYPEPRTPDGVPVGNSSAYSAVILYTTHILDAAVQTINALHKKVPFDFGIALGDATNNTQYNELRWYIDVLDGKMITPSSGAHQGAGIIDYQSSYQAAGLDRSIPWFQTVGNHDLFWMGSAPLNDYLRETYVGSQILNIGPITTIPPHWATVFSTQGLYMGVIDGRTKYGRLINAGSVTDFPAPPEIVADPNRRSLSMTEWMGEFLNTTSSPAGHGFTQEMIDEGFACYSFHPRAGIPIKVIVLDNTDKVLNGAAAALDQKRYDWLVQELDEGETAGELMIICAHIPLRPYAHNPSSPTNPLYPLWSLWSPLSEVTEDEVLAKLHTYKNLILWLSGHVHRNAITPQPSPDGNPEYGFWEVETPSLRDFPQQLRRFEIVLNSDHTLSIFALDIDVAVNPAPLANGSASPACISRSYAVATQQIFQTKVQQGPNVDPYSGVYNAELVKQLSPAMQTKLASLAPVVSSLRINGGAALSMNRMVTLNNMVLASQPTHYKASESARFEGAVWRPYSEAPSFILSPAVGSGSKTVYFKVKDRFGRISATVRDTIRV